MLPLWGTESHWHHVAGSLTEQQLESLLHIPHCSPPTFGVFQKSSVVLGSWLLRDGAGEQDLKASGTQWHFCSFLPLYIHAPCHYLCYFRFKFAQKHCKKPNCLFVSIQPEKGNSSCYPGHLQKKKIGLHYLFIVSLVIKLGGPPRGLETGAHDEGRKTGAAGFA